MIVVPLAREVEPPMRPDAIDWTTKKDCLGLTLLPRQRLHRRLWRCIVIVIVVQAGITALIFTGLQVTHRPQYEFMSQANFADSTSRGSPNTIVALQDARRLAWNGAAAICGSLLIVALVALPLSHRMLRQWSTGLTDVHTAIRRLAQGAKPKPVPIRGDDEAGYLLLAFNDMAGKLLASRKALVDANEVLELRVAQQTRELQLANVGLEQKNAELAELTDTALRFTDDVAHEFRTPLTVIMEFASIIADQLGGPVTEKQAEYLQFIVDSSNDLAHLVDDFLDSGKLRARRLRVDRQSHTVQEILDAAWPLIEPRATSKKVSLEQRVRQHLPRVYADLDKARRTLVNLAINAIKFSKPGSPVVVSAEHSKLQGVEISIIDQGPGMTADELSNLFQRFRQGSEGERANTKGFGLGLDIVRNLVAINLGSISVSSEPGKGSTFTFGLPPDDPSTIVQWYLKRVLERDAAAHVSALRVDRGSSTDLSEIRTFIASAVYPDDVQVPCADQRSMIVVGETVEPARWRDRLLSQDEDHRRHWQVETLEPLGITQLGTWPACEALSGILAHAHLNPALEATCA